MKKNNILNNGIPISVSLNPVLESEKFQPRKERNKKRLLYIAFIAFLISIGMSFVAKLLVHLIAFITNLFFFGTFSFADSDPAQHHLGIFVIVIPIIGGIIVGLMALFGSKAIRGHGIPEAMEQVLTNESKIKPAITFLKPVSAAISIGTGGPFGAEGPIIATGGALGSTIGQLLKISNEERKVLLAAGATAGMSAIFGTPIAAIFLAIELLLFEFSPRSIIPIAIACITGAAGHHLFFSGSPVFAMGTISAASNTALASYSLIGILIGLLSVIVSRSVYLIEDLFEKIPLHWMWWPAIGGLAVGVIGYFAPRTLGVGYYNITDLLSGTLPIKIVLFLCVLKFTSWAIALGSGTSGGTLAPLLTIGGATGTLLGSGLLMIFPEAGINLPLCALVGMSAMFAGASRALLTSIVFALETTMQSNALLPLLGACIASYLISYFLMENTIMTEKIARRGVNTPHSYETDILENIKVQDAMREEGFVINSENTIEEVKTSLQNGNQFHEYFIVTNAENAFQGIVKAKHLSGIHTSGKHVSELIYSAAIAVNENSTLRKAVERMAEENVDVVAVHDENNHLISILSYKDVLPFYKKARSDRYEKSRSISLKRKGLKVLLRGQQFIEVIRKKQEDDKEE